MLFIFLVGKIITTKGFFEEKGFPIWIGKERYSDSLKDRFVLK